MTAPEPPLPTFVVGGAMRSGTTALYEWFGSHPDVFMSPVKELHFFAWDDVWERGLPWYRAQFAGWSGEAAVGEASPGYMFSPDAPRRIAEHLPDVRFIVSLRDPVERAYSHWWYHRLSGREHASFEKAIGLDRPGGNPSVYERRGFYADQIERVLGHLPTKQVKAVLTDDMRDQPADTFSDLCRFVGVDPSAVPPAESEQGDPRYRNSAYGVRWQSGWRARVPRAVRPLVTRWVHRRLTWEPMEDRTRRQLTERFAEPNERLAELIGRDLSHWS